VVNDKEKNHNLKFEKINYFFKFEEEPSEN